VFVVDKVGRLISYLPGAAGGRVYLDLRSKVNSAGNEQGMLGVAFYPGFKNTPIFWVTYTRSDGALVVSKFKATSAAALTASPATEQPMIVVPHPTYTNHNAGDLAFGKDATLYISTGDGGGAGDPLNQAQSGRSLSGKILRVDIQHSCAPHPLYCIPADNPLAAFPQYKQEVWQVGLRNPWRFSVDPVTGALWIGDVGQDRYEEIDVSAPTQKGLNFGWSCREANSTYSSGRCVAGVHYVAPVAVIPHPSAEALIGGLVYRGAKYASLMGARYVFGDYVTGTVWTMPGGGSRTVSGHLTGVTSFGADQNNELWATTLSGGLYQMSAR
jgi:glucose/arabinose dehydrogenase